MITVCIFYTICNCSTKLACKSLRCNLHFAVNCGDKSCLPIAYFIAEKIDTPSSTKQQQQQQQPISAKRPKCLPRIWRFTFPESSTGMMVTLVASMVSNEDLLLERYRLGDMRRPVAPFGKAVAWCCWETTGSGNDKDPSDNRVDGVHKGTI
jgi:hypothetical protein